MTRPVSQDNRIAYTASEAARLLGVTPPTIARYLERGWLREAAIEAGAFRFVDATSVEEFLSQPRPRGRRRADGRS